MAEVIRQTLEDQLRAGVGYGSTLGNIQGGTPDGFLEFLNQWKSGQLGNSFDQFGARGNINAAMNAYQHALQTGMWQNPGAPAQPATPPSPQPAPQPQPAPMPTTPVAQPRTGVPRVAEPLSTPQAPAAAAFGGGPQSAPVAAPQAGNMSLPMGTPQAPASFDRGQLTPSAPAPTPQANRPGWSPMNVTQTGYGSAGASTLIGTAPADSPFQQGGNAPPPATPPVPQQPSGAYQQPLMTQPPMAAPRASTPSPAPVQRPNTVSSPAMPTRPSPTPPPGYMDPRLPTPLPNRGQPASTGPQSTPYGQAMPQKPSPPTFKQQGAPAPQPAFGPNPQPTSAPSLGPPPSNVQTSVAPASVYDDQQMRAQQNVAAANAVPAMADLQKQFGGGFSMASPAYQAGMGAMAGQQMTQGAGQAAGIGNQMGWQNSMNLLGGQQGRDQEALGWANLANQNMANQWNLQNQQQKQMLGFLGGAYGRM